MSYQVPPEHQRLLAEIANLREDVRALQSPGRGRNVPMFEEDPPADSGINFWMLYDGRLRGRTPDGTIREWSPSNHTHPGVSGSATGGGTSGTPAPPPAYVPSSRRYLRDADWAQSYNKGGSQQRATENLYYGSSGDAFNGEQKSMIHFPGLSELSPGPSGTRIDEVWLTLTNRHTWSNAGGILRLGLHNAGSKPGAFSEVQWAPIEVRVFKEGYTQYGPLTQRYRLPNWVGDWMRDGGAQGITLNQRTSDRAFYGYARAQAQLEILYIK